MHGEAVEDGAMDVLLSAMKEDWRELARNGGVADVVFIGSTSDAYARAPSRMVDFDAFVFVPEITRGVGELLQERERRWASRFAAAGIAFEQRVIEGPYKPNLSAMDRPLVFSHLGIFTEDTYLGVPPLKRWVWRKYRGLSEGGRMARLAPGKPGAWELVNGKKGLRDRRRALAAGVVAMEEIRIPSMDVDVVEVRLSDPNFNECCFAYAATSVRNYARLLGLDEADRASNRDFFPWFDVHVLHVPGLLDLMRLKDASRDEGFPMDAAATRALAVAVIDALIARVHPLF